MKRIIIVSGLILLLLSGGIAGCATLPGCNPEPAKDRLTGGPSEEKCSESLVTMPITLYQTYVSGADGHRCPMSPSCSSYAMEAFKKYGLIRGWIMTCDRLLRCGRDETRLSPSIYMGGKEYIDDPVKNNVFD